MRALVCLLGIAIPDVAHAQLWQDATAKCLGTTAEWSSKLEVADVDGDGLPDILVANGGNYASAGTPEPVRVWRNLGAWDQPGVHCMEISAQADGGFVGLSRVIKAGDVDRDGDLDLLTGGAYQTQAKLFVRDAAGWTDATAQLPQQLTSIGDAKFGDVDGDGDLDLVLADWGAQSPGATGAANPPEDDNQAVWLDVDSDGDADLLVASLSGPERLLINDGSGHFTLGPAATPNDTPGSLGIAVADFDGDGRLDVVQSQGEVAFPEKLQLASTAVAIDTAKPVVSIEMIAAGATRVRARVHDHQSPSRLHDWNKVVLTTSVGHQAAQTVPMTWYGEYLWTADITVVPPATTFEYSVCATDRQGNTTCAGNLATAPDAGMPGDAGTPGKSAGCCDASPDPRASLVPFALLVLLLRRRR